MNVDEQDAQTAARIADLMVEPTPYEWEVVSSAASKELRAARLAGWEAGAIAMRNQVGVMVRYQTALSDDVRRLPIPKMPEEPAS